MNLKTFLKLTQIMHPGSKTEVYDIFDEIDQTNLKQGDIFEVDGKFVVWPQG